MELFTSGNESTSSNEREVGLNAVDIEALEALFKDVVNEPVVEVNGNENPVLIQG
jgi:hypothetical protein